MKNRFKRIKERLTDNDVSREVSVTMTFKNTIDDGDDDDNYDDSIDDDDDDDDDDLLLFFY